MTTEELYRWEHWLELGFAGILAGACPLIYKSREASELQSPRIEIKAIAGPVMDHSRSFQDGSTAYDAFEASLEITIVTNRSGNEGTMNHASLIGIVRSRMTMRQLCKEWQSPALAPVDLRATGTADTFSDENDIDTTVLTYYTANTVKQSAWPDL
jgi:hypothetical protein